MALDGASLCEDARQEVFVRVLQAPVVDGFLWTHGELQRANSLPAVAPPK